MFKSVLASRGAAKYWYTLPRVPLKKKGWKHVFKGLPMLGGILFTKELSLTEIILSTSLDLLNGGSKLNQMQIVSQNLECINKSYSKTCSVCSLNRGF